MSKKFRNTACSFMFLFLVNIINAQSLKTYKGEYNFENKEGIAQYSYIVRNNEEVKQGNFTFKSKAGTDGSYTTTGFYINNEKSGTWNTIISWSTYNGIEEKKSVWIYARASEYTPFEEVTKKIQTNYLKDKKEGKEIVNYTTIASWLNNGSSKKTWTYRKEKTWKSGILQHFNFETILNGVKVRSVKGRYSLDGDDLVYDGEWTGISDGESFVILYDKGKLKSVSKKNINSGKITEIDTYSDDKELNNKYLDKNSIPILYDNNKAKLLISKIDQDNFEFELFLVETTNGIYTDNIKNLSQEINLTESDSPIWNSPTDNDWIAYSFTIKKNYLSNKRENRGLKQVTASYDNATKIFDVMDESNIKFIGSSNLLLNGKDEQSDWENEEPTYFSTDLYLQNLIYKGKAQKVLEFYQSLPEFSKFGYSDIGSLELFPYYFLAVSLAGDTLNSLKIIKSSIDDGTRLKYKDGSIETYSEIRGPFYPGYTELIKSIYSSDRISFLKNFNKYCVKFKNSIQNKYLESLVTVKIGKLNWTNTFIEPEKLGVSLKALKFFDEYNPNAKINTSNYIRHENVVIILDYLNKDDIKKLEPEGWRIPSINEIKELFSRKFDDYEIKLFKESMMDGTGYYLNNGGYTEYRYLCKDNEGKIVVYNATTDEIVPVIRGDGSVTSGFCQLVKKE